MIRVERGTRHEPPVDSERRARPVIATATRAVSQEEVQRIATHEALSGEQPSLSMALRRWALGIHPMMRGMTRDERIRTEVAGTSALGEYASELEFLARARDREGVAREVSP